MADWSALLDHLATGPREDGTPQLAATAAWLVEELQRRGLEVKTWAYTAHPWRLRIVGVAALLGAVAYSAAMLKQRRWLAVLVAVSVPAYIILELDFGVPLLGALHSAEQQHVIATLPSARPAKQRLIFSAHYDTKTDLLDHVERTPIQLLGLPLTLLMLVAAVVKPRPRLTKVAVAGALLNGVGLFLVQTGGAFVPGRSPGAVDDGAGCAVLLELGSTLRLQQTEVQLVFFSGEEIGLEGSMQWVARGLDRSLPVKVLNLDGVGMTPQLALFKGESGVVRSFKPDPELVAVVEQVTPLYRTFYPATTDARVFLAAGVPALNLASDLPEHALPRHLHSTADQRGLVSEAALDETVRVLAEVAKRLDAQW